jgi:hypothetical protein
MPAPSRPVSGEAIATDWGQEIHDRTFSPKGCRVHGGSVSMGATAHSLKILDLSSVDDDPGGWLDAANDRLEVPADAGGIYTVACLVRSGSGVDGELIRAFVYVNGSEATRALESCETGVEITIALGAALHLALSPGDLITIRSYRVAGTGATPSCSVHGLSLIRLCDEYGA